MYAFIKERQKNIKRHMSWDYKCFHTVADRFEYNGTEVEKPEFISQLIVGTGLAAIFKDKNDEWIVTPGTRTGGKLNAYGRLSDLTCHTRNGEEYIFKDFENPESSDYSKVAIIRNNIGEDPDTFYMQYADVLAEIDKSIMHIIKNSRLAPIIACKDEKTKNAIQSALDNGDTGEIRAVLTGIDPNNEGTVEVINLTDVAATNLIQYLYKAKDDTLRQFYQHYGICGSGEAKMAQLTEAEVEKGNNSYLIESYEQLEIQKKDIEIMNEKFGWNASVSFSKVWEREDAHHEVPTEVEEEENVEDEETLQDRESDTSNE